MAIMQHNELNKFNISDTERKHGGRRPDVTLPPSRGANRSEIFPQRQKNDGETLNPSFCFHLSFSVFCRKGPDGLFHGAVKVSVFLITLFSKSNLQTLNKRY